MQAELQRQPVTYFGHACRGAPVQGADTQGEAARVRAVPVAQGPDERLPQAGGLHALPRVGPDLLREDPKVRGQSAKQPFVSAFHPSPIVGQKRAELASVVQQPRGVGTKGSP